MIAAKCSTSHLLSAELTGVGGDPFLHAGAADDWLTPGRFALLLGLLIAATFPGVLLGSSTFIIRDFGMFGYPLAYYHRQSFWRGELPLWNPFSNCGLPFLARWNTLALYQLLLNYLCTWLDRVSPLPATKRVARMTAFRLERGRSVPHLNTLLDTQFHKPNRLSEPGMRIWTPSNDLAPSRRRASSATEIPGCQLDALKPLCCGCEITIIRPPAMPSLTAPVPRAGPAGVSP